MKYRWDCKNGSEMLNRYFFNYSSNRSLFRNGISRLWWIGRVTYDEKRTDIVQTIEFGNPEKLVKYCQGIQMGSPIDSSSIPEPWDMPGYTDKIIMASGAFTQGSSIELSCDAPIREPYIAFMQGGLTYEYGKIGVMRAIENIL